MLADRWDTPLQCRTLERGSGDVKIHKLLYYCQGWHLARTGEPLFAEPIEAWLNGPVVAELWRDEKRAHRPSPAALALDAESRHTVEIVVARYGDLTGKQLIRLTHDEPPWRDASEREDAFVSATISVGALIRHFEVIHEVYGFGPMRMTPERLRIIDEAKARTA